uniref:Uncharacterized protein n=1 Tax=Panagrolaimus sp. ES5 TaxID=591445 RepID=A0AC34FTG3_9BILA
MKFFAVLLLLFIFSPSLFLDIDASKLQRYKNGSTVASFDELNKFYASNGTKIVDEHVEQLFADKSIEESKVGRQNGRNVTLTGESGNINLTLKGPALTFRFCTGYTGIIQICYDTTSPNSALKGSCDSSSQCELYIDIDKENGIKFSATDTNRYDFGSVCHDFQIYDTESIFHSFTLIRTCPPRIENGIIHLDVKAVEPQCQVEVVDAIIKYPETPTTTPLSTAKPIKPTSKSSIEWWGIVIIVILVLILFCILGTFGYLCWKKRKTSKPTVAPTVIPATVISESIERPSTTIQTASKTLEPNFEPRKSQKKQKKAVKKEIKTIEEFIPPPKVTVSSPPDPTKTVSKMPECSVQQHVMVSLDETSQNSKFTSVESVITSVSRNVLKSKDSEMVEEMKLNYPEVNRSILDTEIFLFCVQISVMCSKLNEIGVEAEKTLTLLGVQFDGNNKIISVSPEARQYLQSSETPISIVYFAFGAEYHEYITDDMEIMPKLSVAHQLVIALQPRFIELNRRKTLAGLRRELSKIRENYTASERKNMPFPINAIEKAFVRDPKYFISSAGIDTDSEAEREKIAEAKKKQQSEIKK